MKPATIDFCGSSMGILYFKPYLNIQSQSAIKPAGFYRHFQCLHKEPHLSVFSAELKTAQFCLEKCQTCKLLSEHYCKPLFWRCMNCSSETFFRLKSLSEWTLVLYTRMDTGSLCPCQKSRDLESLGISTNLISNIHFSLSQCQVF